MITELIKKTISSVVSLSGEEWQILNPDAYIPPVDQVTIELAKSVLIGRELTSHNGWGQELSHIIAEEDLAECRKVIYPFITETQLELRVCWEFTPSHWQILMDTATGKILVEQDVAFYLL